MFSNDSKIKRFYIAHIFIVFIGAGSLSAFSNLDSPKFDSLAQGYEKSQVMPIREAIDDYSVLQYLNLGGKKVLDLSCKDGHFTRLFARQSASQVIGYDPSETLVHLAQSQNAENSVISYAVGDIFSIKDTSEDFDVVTSIFLLHFSSSVEELERMFEIAFKHLKPGGILLAINENMLLDQPNLKAGYYHKYQYETVYQTPIKEGSKFDVKLFNDDKSIVSFSGYHYSFETYQKAALKAGFESFTVLPLMVSPKAINERGNDYWQAFLKKPNTVVIKAFKPN